MITNVTAVTNDEDKKIVRLRRFCKKVQANMGKYIKHEGVSATSPINGCTIRIESTNGLKYKFENGTQPLDKNFYIRYAISFFSENTKSFFGNTYFSENIDISFDNSNTIQISNPINVYYFSSSDIDKYKIVIEVIFLTTTLQQIQLKSEVLAWAMFDVADVRNASIVLYTGTCREILYRDTANIGIVAGATMLITHNHISEIDMIKPLLPPYAIFGPNTEVPGLLLRYIPKDIDFSEPIKMSKFDTIYIKNIEIEFGKANVIGDIIRFANDVVAKRKKLSSPVGINGIVDNISMEVYAHNTWSKISTNVKKYNLSQKGSFLIYKGTIPIENFFVDALGLCGIIIEISITININNEMLKFPIAFGIIVPSHIDYDNSFEHTLMFTGHLRNLSSEEMVDIKSAVRLSFALSRSKEDIVETFQDKQIQELSYKIENVKESIQTESDYKTKVMMNSQLNELEEQYRKKNDTYKNLYNRESQGTSLKQSIESVVPKDHQFLIDQQKKNDEQSNIMKSQNLQQEQQSNPLMESRVIESTNNANIVNVINTNIPNKNIDNEINNDTVNTDYNYFTEHKKKNDIIDEIDMFSSFKHRAPNTIPVTSMNTQPNVVYMPTLSKQISTKDEAMFRAKGIIDTSSDNTSKSIVDIVYKNELKNRNGLFGDVFTLNFNAFKPLKNIDSYDNIPNEIKFQFSFFDFDSYITDSAFIKKPTNVSIIPSSAPLFIEKKSKLTSRMDEKQLKTIITFDPSANDNIDYKTYITYLLSKTLFVSVIDSERQINFGFFKIPLKILLKQGKNSLILNKEYEIYDYFTYDKKGSIQMLIKSEMIKSFKNIDENDIQLRSMRFQLLTTKSSAMKVKKKKVVSVTPFNMNTLTKTEKELLAKKIYEEKRLKEINKNISSNNKELVPTYRLDKDTEKRIRVLRFLSSSTKVDEVLSEKDKRKIEEQSKFYETINYANKVKSINKDNVIQKAINESNDNILSISLIQGNPHYFNYVVVNNENKQSLYHIVISNDSTEQIVSIVTNPTEYERITRKKKLKIPNDYNCITNDYYLILKPFESVPLLVKLLSFSDEIENNKYTIWVYNEKNVALYYMTIIVVKVVPIIDHVFEYKVPSCKMTSLTVMNPFKYNKEKTSLLSLNMKLKNDNIIIKLDSKSNDFIFNFTSKSNCEDVYVNYIFAYLDDDNDELFATWKISIKSYDTVPISSSLGVRTKSTLSLFPSSKTRTVKFFSSDPSALYFSNPFSSPFIIIPNMRYDIDYVVHPVRNIDYNIEVTCVDVDTKEVVKSWLVKTRPMNTEINQIVKLNCKANAVTNVKFTFVNPLNEFGVIRFESSNKSILTVNKEMISFNANESVFVHCEIKSQNDIAKASVYVFVTDAEDVFNQTILFEINYYN